MSRARVDRKQWLPTVSPRPARGGGIAPIHATATTCTTHSINTRLPPIDLAASGQTRPRIVRGYPGAVIREHRNELLLATMAADRWSHPPRLPRLASQTLRSLGMRTEPHDKRYRYADGSAKSDAKTDAGRSEAAPAASATGAKPPHPSASADARGWTPAIARRTSRQPRVNPPPRRGWPVRRQCNCGTGHPRPILPLAATRRCAESAGDERDCEGEAPPRRSSRRPPPPPPSRIRTARSPHAQRTPCRRPADRAPRSRSPSPPNEASGSSCGGGRQ